MSPKPWFAAALAAPLVLFAACGGKASDATFQNAAPSYAALSMDLTTADSTAPALAEAPPALLAAAVAPDETCHPHLFIRTHEVVSRVNRHLWRFLRRVEHAMNKSPDQATDATQVWERVAGGLDERFTMTRTSPTAFTWKLELKKAGDAAFTTVFDGSIDQAGATGAHQGAGAMTLDLTALASVTSEDVAGLITVQFSTFAAARTVVLDAQDVVWDSDANAASAARVPRSAHYVFDREPGKGGSLKIQEQMVFACPVNLTFLPADVKLVSAWYHPATGGVHGRSDALMTGGQLPALSIDRVVGVTCHQATADGDDQTESFWLMKGEDATGATVAGSQHESSVASASACDPALGDGVHTVPTLTDASQDFDMSLVDFTSATPYPFPKP